MKKLQLSSLITFIFLLCFINLHAQNYNISFEHITSDNGLSENVIDAVFQDSQGFLWFGTDEGLNKYDGYQFKIFKNNPGDTNSISDNFIHYIFEDRTGILWISTSKGGLNKFDRRKNKFTKYIHDPLNPKSISSNNVNMTCEDEYHNFWVCTEKGLDKLDRSSGNFEIYYGDGDTLYNRLANSYVNVLLYRKGNLWIGTKTGFYALDVKTGRLKVYVHSPQNKFSISNNFVTSICEDKQNEIWIGNFGGGLNHFDPQTDKFISYRHNEKNLNSISSDFIRSMIVDENNYLWIGTSNDGGLNIFDKNSKRFHIYKNHPNNSKSLSQNEVQCIYQDRAGTIWIGTFEGLNKFDIKGKEFHSYGTDAGDPVGLSDREVHAVFEDNNGILWVGTWKGGLDRINRKKGEVKVYKNNPENSTSISCNSITCILEDKNKRLWIGTADGLNRLNSKEDGFTVFKHNPASNSFYDNAVLTLFEDSEGILWAGTWMQGLIKFDEKTNSFIAYKNDPAISTSISSNMITSIYEDTDNNLWIGTWDGLNKFDRKKNEFIAFKNDPKNPKSISNNSIICMLEDPIQRGKILWLGTWTGLDKFDLITSNASIYRSSPQTFQSDEITGLLSDKRNRLWIATNRGITCLDQNDNHFRTYDKSNGLQGNEFQGRANYKSESGELFFGGDKGLNSFFPDSLYDNNYLPPVVINSFKKFNKEVKFKEDISFIHKLVLSYKDNIFSFGFTALNYIHPEKNKFQYRLLGFDKGWVNAGGNRTATYMNLDPGEYTFMVKAANNDGIWNPVPASISIIITPPFWETWWFRFLGLAIVSALILFVFNKRTEKIKKEKNSQEEFSRKLIESQENERKRIAGELHDSLAQNLLIIKNKALYSKNNLNDEKIISEQLDNISELTTGTLSDIREIAYNLRPYQLDRLGLTKAIESIFDRLSKSTPIKFEINLDLIDEIFNPDVEINIFRIIQECFNNIIKHSSANEAKIVIKAEEDHVAIFISDNGKGFSKSSINSDSHGLGLRNISERVKLIKGKLDVKSEPGRGTNISISIPFFSK